MDYEALIKVNIKLTVMVYMTMCSLVYIYQRVGEFCCLLLQGKIYPHYKCSSVPTKYS
jgi:hypothetical protein